MEKFEITNKNFLIAFDYYLYTQYFKNIDFKKVSKNKTIFLEAIRDKYNLLKLQPLNAREKKNNLTKIIPFCVFFYNFFNFLDIMKIKLLYSIENIKLKYSFLDILNGKADLSVKNGNIHINHMFGLYTDGIKSVFKTNLGLNILSNKLAISSFTIIPFIYKYLSKENLNGYDYSQLFFISLLAFPFNQFLNNFYIKTYLPTQQNEIKSNAFSLRSKFMFSIYENFMVNLIYFEILNYFRKKFSKAYLLDEEKSNCLTEIFEGNPTLNRIQLLNKSDFERVYVERLDIAFPILMTSMIMGLISTPLDFIYNSYKNPLFSPKLLFKNLLTNNVEVKGEREKIIFYRLKCTFAINMLKFLFQYGGIIYLVDRFII